MTQFDERVQKQRDRLAAEAWGNQVKDLHAFDSNTVNVPYTDRKDGSVIDIRFNNGTIKRTISATDEVIWFGKKEKPNSLLHSFFRAMADWRG
tara:strand:- start:297 stop:575 length:279 start_codon:yes stop_codon:yes gene_type:complete